MSIKPWTAPGSPDLPAYRDAGMPATGCGSRTPFRMIRSFPVRSVTSIVPSGRNAKLQGYVSPFVTATTRILWPSAVSNSIGNFGSGRSARPVGATGMLFRNGTCCCTSASSIATYAAIFIDKNPHGSKVHLCRVAEYHRSVNGQSPTLFHQLVIPLLDFGLIVLLILVQLLQLRRTQRQFVIREIAQLILSGLSSCSDEWVRILDRRFGPGVRYTDFLGRDINVWVSDAASDVTELIQRHQRSITIRVVVHIDPVRAWWNRPFVDPLPKMMDCDGHIRGHGESADRLLARVGIICRSVTRVDMGHAGELVNPELISGSITINTRCSAVHCFSHGGDLNHGDIDQAEIRAVARRHEAVIDRPHVGKPQHHVRGQIIGHDPRGRRRTGEDHFPNGNSGKRVILPFGFYQRPYLRNDFVRLSRGD